MAEVRYPCQSMDGSVLLAESQGPYVWFAVNDEPLMPSRQAGLQATQIRHLVAELQAWLADQPAEAKPPLWEGSLRG